MRNKASLQRSSGETLETLRERRGEFLRIATKHGARNVRIFGSVAQGKSRVQSDIDFLVEFSSNRSLIDHVALAQELGDLLGREVDVVAESALHWYIRERILAEAIPL